MKSTVIKKGTTASIILGLGAIFSAYGSSAIDPNHDVLNSNHSSNLTKKITADRFINSNNMYSFNFGLSSVLSTVSKVKGTLSEVKGTLSEVKGTLSKIEGYSGSIPPNNKSTKNLASINVLPINGFSTSFSAYIYEDEGPNVFNVPIIKVYIDGQPVNLILDTGDSGLVVNQSAVDIPSSDYISHSAYSFDFIRPAYDAKSISGVFASATVCLNPSITSSCVVMPIGVLTSGTLFPGEPNEGVFGLAGTGNGILGETFNGNSMLAFSYPHYLEQQTGINSYQISFISLSNNYYANVPPTQPIGQISFGNYNGNKKMLIPYPHLVIFGSYPTSVSSSVFFDTASPLNFLHQFDLQAALAAIVPHYSYSKQEGSCTRYGSPVFYGNLTHHIGSNVVNSSYTISYTIGSYTGSFVTEPPASFCNDPPAFNLLKGITIDNEYDITIRANIKRAGDYVHHWFKFSIFSNIFGLPTMLGHTFTYVLGAPRSWRQGIVQYLDISP